MCMSPSDLLQMRELVQIAEVKPAVLQANSGVLLGSLCGFWLSCCCIPGELPAVCLALHTLHFLVLPALLSFPLLQTC